MTTIERSQHPPYAITDLATFRQDLLKGFLKRVATPPQITGTDEDGITDIKWVREQRVIQVELKENATVGRWLTWLKTDPVQSVPFHDIDLQDPKTWTHILELLNC